MAAAGRAVLDSRETFRLKQILIFVLVGIFNTGFGYLVIFLMMYFVGLGALTSNALGYLAGVIFSYSLNRVFTFKSVQKKSTEFLSYMFFFLFSYGLNFICLYLLINFTNLHAVISQLLAGVVYIVCSFLLQKFFVFRPKVTKIL